EDRVRTELMRDEGQRQNALTASTSLADFLAHLDLLVEVRPPEGGEWGRVAQLTQKTNQFNLSLRRRSLAEVQAFQGPVLVLKASDRFGDYGLVGATVLRPAGPVWELDSLLMSCRALGRGIEDAFLHVIGGMASRQGAKALAAPYVEGLRNSQVLSFLARAGFGEGEGQVWTLPLDPLPPLPEHIRLKIQSENGPTKRPQTRTSKA
ncbi:MAG: methoxymalonyl-ACP biosynthesis protein FkbH, partial [Chloroflexota bacterium]|nr:methoxymalonyl-ACP biosynthesis protein FkbH [Chloroflexota bacterium]